MNTLSPLDAAKEQLSIPQLWAMLDLPDNPGRSCRSPFREDKIPSFSIYNDGRSWRDFGTGEGGDVIDFLSRALNTSVEDACRKLIEIAGVLPEFSHFPRDEKHVSGKAEKARKRESWPAFDIPTASEISTVAALRGLSIEGVSLAAKRGLLFCADSREGQAWVVTDSRQINAQARRMDGKAWERIMAKAGTLPGSEADWPIGLPEASSFPTIALVEGGPDLLAAFHHAWCAGVESQVAVVAILGASNSIPAETLPFFAGKRVRIFPHADEPGMEAAKRWARQLRQVAEKVDGFGFESGDLNDFARAHQAEEVFSSFVAVNVAKPTVDMEEARRIAGELVRMHRTGALSGANDREAEFFACFIHKFGATFGGVSRAA